MGLLVSHGAFRGSYSAFNRLRQFVCAVLGGSFPPHAASQIHLDLNMWYLDDWVSRRGWAGLWHFLQHSDCDGHLTTRQLRLVIRDLNRVLDRATRDGNPPGFDDSDSWAMRAGGYAAQLRQFIAGCTAAVAAHQPLRFM